MRASTRLAGWLVTVLLVATGCTSDPAATTTRAAFRPPSELIPPAEPALELATEACVPITFVVVDTALAWPFGDLRPCPSARVWIDGRYEVGLVDFPSATVPDMTVAVGTLDAEGIRQLSSLVDDPSLAAVAEADATTCAEPANGIVVQYRVATPDGQVTLRTCSGSDVGELHALARNVVSAVVHPNRTMFATRTGEVDAVTRPRNVLEAGGVLVDARVMAATGDHIAIEVSGVRVGKGKSLVGTTLRVPFHTPYEGHLEDDAFDRLQRGDAVVALVDDHRRVRLVGLVEGDDLVDLSSADVTFGLGHVMAIAIEHGGPAGGADGSACRFGAFAVEAATATTAIGRLDELAAAGRRYSLRLEAKRDYERRRSVRTTEVEYSGKPGGLHALFIDRQGLMGVVTAKAGRQGVVRLPRPDPGSKVRVWLVEQASVEPCHPWELAPTVAEVGFEFVTIPAGELAPGRTMRIDIRDGTWRSGDRER
jgi:hypothetical protein